MNVRHSLVHLFVSSCVLLASPLRGDLKPEKEQQYWSQFYLGQQVALTPSPFAEACLGKIDKENTMLELGCGNGRDSLFFASHGVNVIACDVAASASDLVGDHPNLKFLQADFTRLADDFSATDITTIYSRFTLHSVDAEGASRTLLWAYDHLLPEGRLMIEARSEKDDLYGQGESVGRDAFVTSHYRRFLRLHELLAELETLGFEIEESAEGRDFAIYKDDNPVVLRVVARKPGNKSGNVL